MCMIKKFIKKIYTMLFINIFCFSYKTVALNKLKKFITIKNNLEF